MHSLKHTTEGVTDYTRTENVFPITFDKCNQILLGLPCILASKIVYSQQHKNTVKKKRFFLGEWACAAEVCSVACCQSKFAGNVVEGQSPNISAIKADNDTFTRQT